MESAELVSVHGEEVPSSLFQGEDRLEVPITGGPQDGRSLVAVATVGGGPFLEESVQDGQRQLVRQVLCRCGIVEGVSFL